MSNRGAFRALGHPLWVGALVVLVLNDHVFKGSGLLPGWLTGKLSDFSGLVVASPLLAAALRCRSRWAIAACHAAVAVPFVAIKTSPAASHVFVQALSFLHARNTVDPTDLMALVVLPFSYWMTNHAVLQSAAAARPISRRDLILAAAGALGCVADQPPRGGTGGAGGAGGSTTSSKSATSVVATSAHATVGTGSFSSGATNPCADGLRDGAETDVDCGGGSCAPCANGEACAAESDCASGRCAAGTCEPCMFDSQCGSNAYCDTSTASHDCKPRGTDGVGCTTDDQCNSGHCAHGVCCDTACAGGCWSCNAALTGLAGGVCGPVKAGFNPDDACAASACALPSCDGAGACGFRPVGTACAPPACANDALSSSACDASHQCAAAPIPCPSHLGCFGGAMCAASCGYNGVPPLATSEGCAAGYFCDTVPTAPLCVDVKKAKGTACVNAYECAGGGCVAGACN